MAARASDKKMVYIAVAAIVALIVGFFVGYAFTNTGKQAPRTPITIPTTTSVARATTVPSSTNASAQQASNSASVQVVKNVLYTKKTITVPAASYNPYYNYVVGCYWEDGWYNLSFSAPYPGYVVINETNTGIPTNYSYAYFGIIFSKQKPIYFAPQPYNEASFCPGVTFISNIKPWTQLTPYSNQTMIVPVQNGTNYIIFENGNANQKHGVNPFPINVTFSMTYYGFKGTSGIPAPPNTTTPPPPANQINWGSYQTRGTLH